MPRGGKRVGAGRKRTRPEKPAKVQAPVTAAPAKAETPKAAAPPVENPKADRLTLREEIFVAEYLIDLNAKQAYLRAGYKGTEKTAEALGPRLIRRDRVKRAIEAAISKQVQKAELSASRVLEELRRLAFSDVRALFDSRGNLRPLNQLSDEQASCVASVEVIIKNAKAGDGQTDEVHKVKVWDKPKALEMLAKHFVLLTEKVQVDASDALIGKLLAGRKRAAEARAGAR